MTTYENVSSRAVLVTLNVSTWTARKFDKRVTEDVAVTNSAGNKAGRYNKDLLAGAEQHKAVTQASGAARRTHYMNTLPWSDEGWRLLPTANYQAYVDAMRKARDTFDSAVDTFVSNYSTLREDARRELGALYNSSEYPDASRVREKFDWAIEFAPVPTVGDIRVALPDDEIASIEQRIESRVIAATRDAMADAWDRLRESVTRIAKASQEEGIIRNNLIENARETAELLGRLNVSADADLDAMRDRVLRELATVDVDTMREDDAVRAATKAKADAILESMNSFFSPALNRADAA